MRKTLLKTIPPFLLAFATFAQQPYSETVEVRVVNVDVVVTDRAGDPVEGLDPEDFVIFEGGKEKKITNFYEVRGSRRTPETAAPATETAADPRLRRIAILFDNQSMVPGTRNAAIGRVREFLPRVKRPDDEVMIASIYNGLKINLQFTKDLDAVLASLDALKKAPTNGVYMQQARRDVERHLRDIPEGYSLHKLGAGPSRPGMSEQPPYGDAINAVQYYANNVLHSVSQTTDSAYSFIASLAGLDGRKIILFATEALPTYPGREAFEYLNAIKGEFSGGAHRQPVTENLNAYDATPMIVRIAEIANKSGVTLYPLHVGGPTQIMRGADEANDDKQNYNSLTGFKGVSAAQSINSTAVLPFLAEQTGGIALVESTNFDRVFDHIENDLSTYYSLGYRPERDASDAARNVQVKLRTDTGYIIRYRRGVVERTSESAQKEELTAALSHDAQKNELGISLQFLDAVAAADGGTKVPIRIVIPMDALTLMPDGTDLTGKLSIFVRFARNDGVMSEVSRRTNEFRFPASTRSRRKELTIQTDLTMDPGVRRVSVGVVDELSQISGFAIWEPPGTSGQ